MDGSRPRRAQQPGAGTQASTSTLGTALGLARHPLRAVDYLRHGAGVAGELGYLLSMMSDSATRFKGEPTGSKRVAWCEPLKLPETRLLDQRRVALDGERISVSPFLLLADGIDGARKEMGLWTLAIVGATFAGKPGFVLLADHAELAAGGYAEDIQDHTCAIASPKP